MGPRGGRANAAPAIRDPRDLLYWQYAKTIADSSGLGKRNYGFVMERFVKLRSGGIRRDSIREYVKERDDLRWPRPRN